MVDASPRVRVLVLGASYGSLLAARLLMAGHAVTLVCRAANAALIRSQGIRVRIPVKGEAAKVEIDSRRLPGHLDAMVPQQVDAAAWDLAVLAMQEPQYGAADVRALMQALARAGVPCLSLMNMPPLPYLQRLAGVDRQACAAAYADASVWDGFQPGKIALCSPDPQAVRPAGEPANVLEVRLATNFKSAPFGDAADTALLRRLERDIEAARLDRDGGDAAAPAAAIELPVKLKVHDSIHVPLAKWSMLLAGNYRCVQPQAPRSIERAVHSDLAASRDIYDWVGKLCRVLGARDEDLVPFDKYAAAAHSLVNPSSVARAIAAGAEHVERVDQLVRIIAAGRGLRHPALDEIVELLDEKLRQNQPVPA